MKQHYPLAALAAAALLALGACGGGGGGDDDDDDAEPLVLNGTAATGAAIVGAAVSVKCADGEPGSATTGAGGSYSVTIDGGKAPCLVELTDGTDKLYSLVEAGSASPATVNVTPLTTLLTAQVLAGDPAAAFADFDDDEQDKLSPAAVDTATAQLTTALAGKVDFSGPDPITTPLMVGDPNDQKLDMLQAVFVAAQTNVAELGAALVANPGSAAPITVLLAPSSAGCKSLKTAPVRIVRLDGFERISIDATALTFTSDGQTFPLTDAGGCKFTTPDGTISLIGPASIGVNRIPAAQGKFTLSFGFPEQTIPLSELAGTYNYVAYINSVDTGPGYAPAHGSFTLDASGKVSNSVDCTGLDNCTTDSGPGSTLAVNAEGGFDILTGQPSPNRVFAYRAPSGTLMLFIAFGSFTELGVGVATLQAALPLPANLTVTPFNQFTIGSTGATANAIVSDTSTVISIDASGSGSFNRRFNDGHTDTVLLNTPRSGMRHRPAGSSPNTGGMPVSFSSSVQLRPAGTGLNVSLSADPAQNFFSASVDAPAP